MGPNLLFIHPLSLPFDQVQDALRGEESAFQDVVLPMGILYLSACLKREGQVGRVGCLDYALHANRLPGAGSLEAFLLDLVESEVDFEPDVVAFSINISTAHHFLLAAAQVLRARWPRARVVAGGVHVTNYAAELLAEPAIDVVFRGEGEFALCDYVRQLALGREPRVRGAFSKADLLAPGALEDMADFVQDLDALPFPDWDLVDMDSYSRAITWVPRRESVGNRRMGQLLTTRGCPWRCTFCASHTTHGRTPRLRSVDSVLEEFRQLHTRYGISLFFLLDDAFTLHKGRTHALLARLKALDIPDLELQFPNAFAVNTTDPTTIDLLRDLGVKTLTFAIESGSPFTQRHLIRKHVDLEKARDLVAYTRSLGLEARCNFIFGFPGETRELMEESAAYVRSLGADWCQIFIATPLLGSEMYQQFLDLGCITPDPERWRSVHAWHRDFDTPEITATEINAWVYRLNLEVNFAGNVNLREGQYQRGLALFEQVLHKYPFHLLAMQGAARCCEGMGDAEAASGYWSRLERALADDPRARELQTQHGDLLSQVPTDSTTAQGSLR